MKNNLKKWLLETTERAIKTFAEAFASFLLVGCGFSEIDWLKALSVAGVATLLSVVINLKNIPLTQEG